MNKRGKDHRMRTILAFVLTAIVISAQQPPPPRQLSPQETVLKGRLEKKVADGTATIQEHSQLIFLSWASGDTSTERAQESWLIENHPEAIETRRFPPQRGNAGEITASWRAVATRPGTSPPGLASAAWYFRLTDHKFAQSIVDRALADQPGQPDLMRMRGNLDMLLVGAITANNVPLPFPPPLQVAPEIKAAFDEVDASRDVPLLLGAIEVLSQQPFRFANLPLFASDDPPATAERWALRVQELDPKNSDLPPFLSRIYELEAGQTADPNWKVELYRKADAIDPKFPNIAGLAMAEFEAGDNEAAARDARRSLEGNNPIRKHNAHTVLGRIALDKGNVAGAKEELLASLKVLSPGNFQPQRVLAQDLLDKGEREAVIDFFEKMRPVWQSDQGAIDHYIRLAKSPGHPDITAFYLPGQQVRGRQPNLPKEFAGKPAAIEFRRADCSICDAQFDSLQQISATSSGLMVKAIDAADKSPLIPQLEIDTYPTIVLINRDGRVLDYLVGNTREEQLRNSIGRMMQGGPLAQQRLPAPKPVASDSPVKLAWSPVEGAESYVVQLDQRDAKGWISDRDDKLVRVIPSAETNVTLDPSNGETASPFIRWRVFAVSRLGPGSISDWREVHLTP